MFGKKYTLDEMDVSHLGQLKKSHEFLRMWAQAQGPMTCLIDPSKLGSDPFLFGIAMVDAIRHGAKAYAHAVNISEEHALERITEGFDAERDKPTDWPSRIN